MSSAHPLLVTFASALDDIEVALCAFDEADHALLWNRSFLRFFPEHAGFIHAGEHYRHNLRRFYERRLGADELPAIERYIDEGLARHRSQQQPYSFEHRGRRLRVASLPLRDTGRVRVWTEISPTALPAGDPDAAPLPAALSLEGIALFDYMADGVMVTDATGCIVRVNEAFAALYGLSDRNGFVGQRFGAVYRQAWQSPTAAASPALDHGMALLAERLRFAGAPFELPLPGERWVRITEHRSPDAWGFFTHVDITVLKRQQSQLMDAERRTRASEAQLREQSSVLEAMLQRMEQGIMMVNAQRVVEVCNRRAIELLGLPPALMASKPSFAAVLDFQWATDEFARTPDDIQDFVRAGGILDRAHSYDRTRPDGRVIEIHSLPIEGGGVLRTFTDITERRRTEERIRHIARHDGLTSLVNREVFREQLAQAVLTGQQPGQGFAVHYLDLNRFKPVNDRLGHAVGDRVLAQVAERLRAVARDGDVVARMGGDEFAILQRRAEHPDAAAGLARRILERIAQPMEIEGHSLQVGVSIGIALFPADGLDADSLLRNADGAMYDAKARGHDAYGLSAGAAS